jgi:pSer/pThr/pTyr-binding forkhead associated (FHA) protein
MFDLFKSRPKDVKGIRGSLLQFIKEQLQKAEGGEGGNIKGLCLYINCNEVVKHLYEAAVYAEEEDRFKLEEVQKIADDYAINLPANWTLEVAFIDTPPPEARRSKEVDAALFISTRSKPAIHKEATAYIRVLNGEAEKEVYTISSTGPKITIGREKNAQTADGFFRENAIAFPGTSSNDSNRSVSRQHAHIEWDAEGGWFYIFADEGGIPPLNKLKVRTAEGNLEKIQTTEIGHRLREGDQIMLGEGAVLEFTFHEK